MTTTEPQTMTVSTRLDIASPSVKSLRSWLRRWDRWHTAIDAYQNGAEYPSVRLMPSKESKHRAYGAASHILRCLPELPQDRPTTVDGLRKVLADLDAFRVSQ